MAERSDNTTEAVDAVMKEEKVAHPDPAILKKAFRLMLTSRRLDEKMLILLKQGKSFFHIGGSGHEAVQIAAAFSLRPGTDWAYPYYRDLPFNLALGMTPEEVMLCFLSRAEDPNSGGRQMPAHYGHKELRMVSQSSPTGTQFLQAVGCAMGAVKDGTDEVVYVSAGEGTTSQGDFHEALNWASRDKLPVIFLIEDNKYAISVPIAEQTSGSSVYNIAAGYESLERYQVDGTDFLASYQVMHEAVARARSGEGPCIVVADVVRLLPHSSSDDQRKYRSEEEIEADRARDPIPLLESVLRNVNGMAESAVDAMREEVKAEIDAAADYAESRPFPEKESATLHVYDDTGKADSLNYETNEPAGEPIVLVDAINHALSEELERDDRMLMFGQDIAGEKGGVFTATRGLTKAFGVERVFNAPLAESSIVGVAVGLAVRGFKPVVEVQFGDYIWTAMMQIRNEVATMRYRSANAWQCPLVIRAPIGGYIHGSLYHSQNLEAIFAHIPGIYIALPSNAADAKGLLKTAIRLDDPVLFLEHKALYRQPFAKSPEPDADYLLPFGVARIVQKGSDVTVVTYGALVQKSLEASRRLADETGLSVEIIDLRTISPLDKATMIESVEKTGRLLVVHEDMRFQGFGAEVASTVAEEAFEFLDAPVRRLGAKDAHVPYNWFLEEAILPQEEDVYEALKELAAL